MRQGKQRAHIRSYLRSLDLPTFGKLTCKHIHALELATILSIPPLRRNRASLSRVADIASLSPPSDILSESFSVFAKDCYVKACARLDLYALTSAGNIRDYLRSHAYASAYASYARIL